MSNSQTTFFLLIVLIRFSTFASINENFNKDTQKSINDFVTTWDTTKNGSSNNTSITIPTFSGIYYYNVDWDNDGVFDDLGLTNSITHDFKKPGIYTIRISGFFPHFSFNNSGDKLKLIAINQWGKQKWQSMNGMFWGCENLVGKANDTPDLSKVVDMDGMFENAAKFNQYIGDWDTSNINNMTGMFSGAISFNQNINNWDTSKVNNMSFMFNKATSFNQNLNNWNTSNVKSMKSMFQLAINFNGDMRNWNTQNVTKMEFMFSQASMYNKSIGQWNTSNVISMNMMFQGAISFNQDIKKWDTKHVQNMFKMFYKANSFEQDLSNWNMQSIKNNSNMFYIESNTVVKHY
ncbi:MAG TPA: BspA family leucine-rich repeat surface protein [Crocinitomix sp.]|nr:BspA family leucine-rich repeat surface protein [Crocinitomix sp.]